MIICGETIENGEKRKIEIPVKGAEPLEAFFVCGAKPGKTLVLTSGVHGCEYVGVEALRTVFRKLSPEMLSGAVILLPVANPSGFYQGAKQGEPGLPDRLRGGAVSLSRRRLPGGPPQRGLQ